MTQQKKTGPGIQGPIGMSMSGGGMRAVAFHLGSLDYLERIGLLSRLKMLSAVCGGSFAAVNYVLSLVEKTPYQEFFENFYSFLKDIDFIKRTTEHLFEDRDMNDIGRNDLITSLGRYLSEKVLITSDGKPALFESFLQGDIPITDISFHTTEFRHGIPFTFQKCTNPNAPIGNKLISISKEEAGMMRLGDMIAACACFPGVCEPIAFPDDFVWPDGKIPPGIRKTFSRDGRPRPIALMDGSLLDNQGLDVPLLSKDSDLNELDILVISDAFVDSDDLYPLEKEPNLSGLSIKTVDWMANVIIILCALSAFSVGRLAFERVLHGSFNIFHDGFTYLIPLFLTVSTAASILWLKLVIRKNLLKIPRIGDKAWGYLRKMTVNQVVDMLKLRAGSLVACMNSIYFNRIQCLRALVLQMKIPDEDKKTRRVSNLIHHLRSGMPFSPLLSNIPGLKAPSADLRQIADITTSIPTVFWYEQEHHLPCIISCGQATICYNLMKFIVRNFGNDASAYTSEVRELWNQLEKDWNDLVDDPYVLLQKRLPDVALQRPPE